MYEVFRDEGGVKMDEATCSTINHQKYYSGEFDVEWGQTIDEHTFDWKKQEMDDYRSWLKLNGYEWEDPRLALGYIKLGQVNIKETFGEDATFEKIYNTMIKNLNITYISVQSDQTIKCDYPYSLDSDGWRQIQIEGLKGGYESRSVR